MYDIRASHCNYFIVGNHSCSPFCCNMVPFQCPVGRMSPEDMAGSGENDAVGNGKNWLLPGSWVLWTHVEKGFCKCFFLLAALPGLLGKLQGSSCYCRYGKEWETQIGKFFWVTMVRWTCDLTDGFQAFYLPHDCFWWVKMTCGRLWSWAVFLQLFRELEALVHNSGLGRNALLHAWGFSLLQYLVCKRKLESKKEALLILSKELDTCQQERDQYKLMANQLRERHQSLKKKYRELIVGGSLWSLYNWGTKVNLKKNWKEVHNGCCKNV